MNDQHTSSPHESSTTWMPSLLSTSSLQLAFPESSERGKYTIPVSPRSISSSSTLVSRPQPRPFLYPSPYPGHPALPSDRFITADHPEVLAFLSKVVSHCERQSYTLPDPPSCEVAAFAAFLVWDRFDTAVHWMFWGAMNLETTRDWMRAAHGSPILPRWIVDPSNPTHNQHGFSRMPHWQGDPELRAALAEERWFHPLSTVPKPSVKRKASADSREEAPSTKRSRMALVAVENPNMRALLDVISPQRPSVVLPSPPAPIRRPAIRRKTTPRTNTIVTRFSKRVTTTPGDSASSSAARSSPSSSDTMVEVMSPVPLKGKGRLVEDVHVVVEPSKGLRRSTRASQPQTTVPSKRLPPKPAKSVAITAPPAPVTGEAPIKRGPGRPRKVPKVVPTPTA